MFSLIKVKLRKKTLKVQLTSNQGNKNDVSLFTVSNYGYTNFVFNSNQLSEKTFWTFFLVGNEPETGSVPKTGN